MEEVKKLSDDELDELVAEKLLRLSKFQGFFYTQEGKMLDGFSPTRRFKDAMMVLERFQKKGWSVELFDLAVYEAAIVKNDRVYLGRSPEPGRAVCMAALSVIGMQFPDDTLP